MRKSAFVTFILGSVLLTHPCFPQGQTAVPFLLISPYAETNGMGEASVAVQTDDPLASITNPAHLGMWSQSNYFSFGYNFSHWLPEFVSQDLWLSTLAVNAGVNWQKLNENAPPLSFGLGYSRMYLNLGTFVRTGSGGPVPIGVFDANESSDQVTVGVGYDSWVRASVGLTYKHVTSRLSPVGTEQEQGTGSATANLFDYGALVDVPLVSVLSRITEDSYRVAPNVSPFLNWSIGISRSNLGQDKVSYIDAAQSDPLPRYARAGIGLDLGFQFAKDDIMWKPISFRWSIEASDVLVGSDRQYQGGLGDIKFFDEVILGNTNKETEKKKGWELNVLDVLSVRGGRFEEDPDRGGRRFNTSGWGLRFGGMLRLLETFNGPFNPEGLGGFILKHCDIGYNHSEWNPDRPDHPLEDTRFDSVTLTISN